LRAFVPQQRRVFTRLPSWDFALRPDTEGFLSVFFSGILKVRFYEELQFFFRFAGFPLSLPFFFFLFDPTVFFFAFF